MILKVELPGKDCKLLLKCGYALINASLEEFTLKGAIPVFGAPPCLYD